MLLSWLQAEKAVLGTLSGHSPVQRGPRASKQDEDCFFKAPGYEKSSGGGDPILTAKWHLDLWLSECHLEQSRERERERETGG